MFFKPWFARKQLLFYRDFGGLTGGHLKVWDYYNHARHAKHYQPAIYFSPTSLWDASNPWLAERATVLSGWQPEQADILFLAGLDWQMLPLAARQHSPQPIINLVQHIRHTQPHDPRYPFLQHKAIRIAVSQEVAAALEDSGVVNGAIFCNPNGIDLGVLPKPAAREARPYDILIAGLKQPQLAQQLAQLLQPLHLTVQVLTEKRPRDAFLDTLNQARITVFLPDKTEGFYLPALEGMALHTVVICPDCIANRSFCLPSHNCFRPPYQLQAVIDAVHDALAMTPLQTESLLQHAKITADEHTLVREREYFLKILQDIGQIW